MTPKSTLAFFLLLSFLTLGSALQERYIRQDSGDTDTDDDCFDISNEKFAVAYPQCADNPGLKTAADMYYLICDANCGALYLSYYVTQCPSNENLQLFDYIWRNCKINEYGRPCYSYLKNFAPDMSAAEAAFLLCKPSIEYNTCSEECSSRLRDIRSYYGSCIDPLFNSSYVPYLPVLSYQLWTMCGVPIPTAASRGRAMINTIYY